MKNLIFLFLFTLPLFAKLYKGAEYRTKEAFTYGKFETRMKPAGKEGMLASFFTYHEQVTRDDWNEIDIEILGRYPNDVQFNPITKGQINHVRHELTSFNPALDYHDYGFEWTPDYVAWFIDGKEVHRQTGDHIKTLNLPQKLMMNVWNPEYANWVGAWSDNVLPAFFYYDWIKYSSYTPGAGNYGTDNNFTVQWIDELDSFDSTRWEKATHTFNGNNCDFIKENVIFENGKMILALTDNVNIGYKDTKGPVAMWARAEKNKATLFFSEEINAVNATNKANFTIPGITIQSAKLLDDKRTVELTTTDINLSLSYNVIIQNQKDNFGNASSPKAITMENSKPLQFPLKVNIGGKAVGDFLPDQEWSEKVEYGFLSGEVKSYAADLQIINTNDDSVYQSERSDFPTYRVRVPNGTYKVTMMFAENYFVAAGSRVFDVLVENQMAENNLDIFAKVGVNSAYTITVTTQVTDGILDLYFQSEIGSNVINGLIVEQIAVGIKQEGLLQPDEFHLEQNFPNPFNPSTTIRFTLPFESKVKISIYKVTGELVKVLLSGTKTAGSYEVTLNTAHENAEFSSGIYFCSIEANAIDRSNSFEQTKKMILLK